MIGKFLMAGNRTVVYTNYQCTGFYKIVKTIAECTGFLGANHAFILWIEIDHQNMFAYLIADVEQFVILAIQRKLRQFIANSKMFVLCRGKPGKKQRD